jgi:hypothetical protein
LLDALSWVVKKSFKGSGKKYVTVTENDAYFSSRKSQKFCSLDEAEIIKWIDFLINNTYFKVGKLIFLQKIGIPMGTDAAPYLANLFLYFFEFSFFEKHNNNPAVCRRLRRCYRYIDDLLYLGAGDTFLKFAPEIYPAELVLNRENAVDSHATFLDLDISVSAGIFSTHIYDKRDNFNFSIVNYPHAFSNIPKSIFRGVLVSQILRFCRASSDYVYFLESVHGFLRKLSCNGYSDSFIRTSVKNLGADKLVELKKFNKPLPNVFAEMITSLGAVQSAGAPSTHSRYRE